MVVNPNVALKVLQAQSGYNLDKVGELSGLGNEKNITQYMSKNMKLITFQKIIGVFGYEIVIRPKGSQNPEDFITIYEEEKVKKKPDEQK